MFQSVFYVQTDTKRILLERKHILDGFKISKQKLRPIVHSENHSAIVVDMNPEGTNFNHDCFRIWRSRPEGTSRLHPGTTSFNREDCLSLLQSTRSNATSDILSFTGVLVLRRCGSESTGTAVAFGITAPTFGPEMGEHCCKPTSASQFLFISMTLRCRFNSFVARTAQ